MYANGEVDLNVVDEEDRGESFFLSWLSDVFLLKKNGFIGPKFLLNRWFQYIRFSMHEKWKALVYYHSNK
jgi:hypothetical protein